MAAVNAFDSTFEDCAKGALDLDTDSLKMMLVTSSYTFSKAHNRRDDITNEVSGTGYSAGGTAVTCTVTADTTNHRVDCVFSSPSWATSTITARGAVIYKARGGASSADELVGFIDFGSDVSSVGGIFQVSAATLRINNF